MKNTIEDFYTAFANLDAETMVNYYHKDIVFTDPAFGELKGEHAKNMWRMLCASQKDKNFVVKYKDVKANENSGSVNWEAFYNFSKTNRKIHNVIHAEFKFKDGKIIEHIDDFNLYKWAQMAFGVSGYLMGWSNFFKKKLNAQTHHLLTKFEKGNER